MKIREIKDIKISSLNKMSDSELEKFVRQTAKIVNTKVNKLYRAGAGIKGAEKIAPDAYNYIEKTGGLISVYNDFQYSNTLIKKTRKELIREVKRAKNFLNLRSSSVRTAKKLQKIRKTNPIPGVDPNSNGVVSEQFKNFLTLKEEFPMVDSDGVMDVVIETDGNIEEAREKLNNINAKWRKRNEDSANEATQRTGFTSKWFK